MNRKVLFLFIIVLLCGCSIEQSDIKTEVANESYGLKVKTGLDEYSPTMSSVPGFPIEIIPYSDSDISDLRLLVTSNDGQFLSWDNSGEIIFLGDELLIPYEEQILYWAPNLDDDNEEEVQLIVIGTYNKDIGEFRLIYRGIIEEDSEGFYSIDFDVNTK